MSDHTRFEIHIYCQGVVSIVRLRGKRRYLREKAYLDEVVGHPYPADLAPRSVPDPRGDLYILTREQRAAYAAFRRELRKFENQMPTRKAQARLEVASEAPIPADFQSFCFSLATGIKYAGSTVESVVRYTVNTLSREESEAALRFLHRIADNNCDMIELQRVWQRCAADLGLRAEGDPRDFFLRIRNEMTKVVKPASQRRHSRR